LGHGNWESWLNVELGWGTSTAKRFIQVADKFKSPIVSDLDFAPTALYLLSQNNTPEEARAEVIDRAEAGEKITTRTAMEIRLKESLLHRPPYVRNPHI